MFHIKKLANALLIFGTISVYASSSFNSAYPCLGDRVKLLQHEIELSKQYSANKAFELARKLKVAGHYAEALSFFKIALAHAPRDIRYNYELGDAYYALGNMKDGLIGNLARWYTDNELKNKLWQGEDVKGKVIFVRAQWGLGDTFQYVRYLKLLKELGATIIFKVQKPLIDIISLCPYIDKVITQGDSTITFDYQIPLTALPYCFKTTLNTIPAQVPYLYADQSLVTLWKNQLSRDKNFKIGICWRGAYRTDPQMHLRSLPLKVLEPLFTIPHVSIYSLQQLDGTEEADAFPQKDKLYTFNSSFDREHGRFMDTAALIKNLDLVLIIDTSIAHLAGGLGKEVWVMLPFAAECRFFMHRTDSPWYPTMRLFRQPQTDDWESVIAQVGEQLRIRLAEFNQIREKEKSLEQKIKEVEEKPLLEAKVQALLPWLKNSIPML